MEIIQRKRRAKRVRLPEPLAPRETGYKPAILDTTDFSFRIAGVLDNIDLLVSKGYTFVECERAISCIKSGSIREWLLIAHDLIYTEDRQEKCLKVIDGDERILVDFYKKIQETVLKFCIQLGDLIMKFADRGALHILSHLSSPENMAGRQLVPGSSGGIDLSRGIKYNPYLMPIEETDLESINNENEIVDVPVDVPVDLDKHNSASQEVPAKPRSFGLDEEEAHKSQSAGLSFRDNFV